MLNPISIASILIILKIVIILGGAELLFNFYKKLNFKFNFYNYAGKTPASWFTDFKLLLNSKNLSIQDKKKFIETFGKKKSPLNATALYSLLRFVLVFVIALLIPIWKNDFSLNYKFTLIGIFILLLLNVLLQVVTPLMIHVKHALSTSRKISLKTFHYLVPFLISIIGIYILIPKDIFNNSALFSFSQIVQAQISENNYSFINPVLLFAWYASIVGLFRELHLDVNLNEDGTQESLDSMLFGWRKGLVQLSKAIEMWIYLWLIPVLFFSKLCFGKNYSIISSFVVSFSIMFLFFIFVSFSGRGKPRVFLDRNVAAFFRTPFIFSAIGLFVSIIIAFFF